MIKQTVATRLSKNESKRCPEYKISKRCPERYHVTIQRLFLFPKGDIYFSPGLPKATLGY